MLTAKGGSDQMSVPFPALYGDWSAPGMLDYATMLDESTTDYSLMVTELDTYGFPLSGKLNYSGTEGLTRSVSDSTIAHVGSYTWGSSTLYANNEGKEGDVTVTAEYQGMTASFTIHVGPYPGSLELYHKWIQARCSRVFLQGKQGIAGAGRDGIHAKEDVIRLNPGDTADISQYLELLDEAGIVVPESNPVTYTSLDESILSVDESGKVTALHTGMVRALLNTGDYALVAVEVTCDHAHTTRTETPAACTEDGYTGDEANLGLWLSLAAATLLAGAAWVTLGKKRRA